MAGDIERRAQALNRTEGSGMRLAQDTAALVHDLPKCADRFVLFSLVLQQHREIVGRGKRVTVVLTKDSTPLREGLPIVFFGLGQLSLVSQQLGPIVYR